MLKKTLVVYFESVKELSQTNSTSTQVGSDKEISSTGFATQTTGYCEILGQRIFCENPDI